jgi:D-3-phosphoglycerate dehydrogenase
VIRKAQGLEMEIAAWSRSLTPEIAEQLGIEYCKTPLEVAKIADAISLHVAVTPETKHLVNKEFLSTMKDGAILVNAARGEVVDTIALKEAINTKGLRVATDVFENEPKGGVAEFTDLELAKMITCTPHIGASTNQSTEAIAEDVVKIVTAYKESGAPINVVNLRNKTIAKYNLVIRHFNRVGVLAKVLDELRNQEINIEEMQNSIFAGGEAATCTLKLDGKPESSLIELLNNSDNIIKVSLN